MIFYLYPVPLQSSGAAEPFFLLFSYVVYLPNFKTTQRKCLCPVVWSTFNPDIEAECTSKRRIMKVTKLEIWLKLPQVCHEYEAISSVSTPKSILSPPSGLFGPNTTILYNSIFTQKKLETNRACLIKTKFSGCLTKTRSKLSSI